MPELAPPPVVDAVSLENVPFLWDGQGIDEAKAVALVTETYHAYKSRRLEAENRWSAAERLYHGVVEPRNWEGTDKPRAALAVPIVYDQVETAYPIITEALFDYWPTFFDVIPGPGCHPAEAAQVRDRIGSDLMSPYDDTGVTALTNIKRAVKQAELYGDGVISIEWDSGQQRPIIDWVDLRDIYWSPDIKGPMIDLSPSVIHRKLLTVEEVRNMDGVDGFKVPPSAVLNHLAKMSPVSDVDTATRTQAAARKETVMADLRTDPRHQLIEVLVYTTTDRIIWVLGQQWCALNRENPLGFIPYCKAPCIEVLGRAYNMSMSDMLEGDQKYAQGIRNARLDNLALMISPPRAKVAGAPNTGTKAAGWRPGLVEEITDPKHVEVLRVENATPDALMEEQMIHQGAAKRFGVNEMAQSGVPMPSNANRTATGVMTQGQNVSKRLSTIVKNFEDYLIVPMLYKIKRMIELFAPETFDYTAPNGQTQLGNAETFSKSIRFRMEAASRMVVRDRLAQFLPMISQLFLNEPFLKQLNLQGTTVDTAEFCRFIQDATATSKSYQFFRQMSETEKAAMQQPTPDMLLKAQMQQASDQTRMQMGQMKVQSDMAKIEAEKDAEDNKTAEGSAIKLLELLQGGKGKEKDDNGGKTSSGKGK